MSTVDEARREVDRATAMYGWSTLADATLAMANALDALIAAVRAEEREADAGIADMFVSVHVDCIAREKARDAPDQVMLSLHTSGLDTAEQIAARIRAGT